MGVTIECKKGNKAIDMGYGGFANLRRRVAKLTGDPLRVIMKGWIMLRFLERRGSSILKRLTKELRR